MGCKTGVLPGIDVRGEGGYIVVPPSGHASGRRYAWEESSRPSKVKLAEWPAWLLKLIQQPTNGKIRGPAPSVEEVIPDGERNDTLMSLAGTMRRRGMVEAEILAALRAVNEARCQPPLSDEEVQGIAASVARYAPDSSERAGRSLPPAHSLTDLQRDAILPVEQSAAPLGGGSQPTTQYHRQTAASLRASYIPTRWLVEGLLPQPGVLLLAGIPGCGKTWLDLSISLAVASGKPWLNRLPTCQGPALLVLEEEDASAVLERLNLLYAGLGLSQEAGDALPVHFLVQQGVSLVTREGTLDPELLRHVQEVQPALIVLDPFRRVHGKDENDSGQMSHLLALLRALTRAIEPPCSIVLVHHLRKRSDHPEDALDRLRGSSDIPASADSVLEIGGEFGHQVAKHSKSKRGPALRTFIVQGDISEQAVSLKFVDPDIKAETDREALRGWLIEALRQGGPHNLRQLCEAGKPRGYGKERIRRTLEALESESQIQSETGPRNSRVYSLTEQSARGARVPPTTTQAGEEHDLVDISASAFLEAT